jgi:hypothetical protein
MGLQIMDLSAVYGDFIGQNPKNDISQSGDSPQSYSQDQPLPKDYKIFHAEQPKEGFNATLDELMNGANLVKREHSQVFDSYETGPQTPRTAEDRNFAVKREHQSYDCSGTSNIERETKYSETNITYNKFARKIEDKSLDHRVNLNSELSSRTHSFQKNFETLRLSDAKRSSKSDSKFVSNFSQSSYQDPSPNVNCNLFAADPQSTATQTPAYVLTSKNTNKTKMVTLQDLQNYSKASRQATDNITGENFGNYEYGKKFKKNTVNIDTSYGQLNNQMDQEICTNVPTNNENQYGGEIMNFYVEGKCEKSQRPAPCSGGKEMGSADRLGSQKNNCTMCAKILTAIENKDDNYRQLLDHNCQDYTCSNTEFLIEPATANDRLVS